MVGRSQAKFGAAARYRRASRQSPYYGPIFLTQTPVRIQTLDSLLRFCNLHHRSFGVQKWGVLLLDSPMSLGIHL